MSGRADRAEKLKNRVLCPPDPKSTPQRAFRFGLVGLCFYKSYKSYKSYKIQQKMCLQRAIAKLKKTRNGCYAPPRMAANKRQRS